MTPSQATFRLAVVYNVLDFSSAGSTGLQWQ